MVPLLGFPKKFAPIPQSARASESLVFRPERDRACLGGVFKWAQAKYSLP